MNRNVILASLLLLGLPITLMLSLFPGLYLSVMLYNVPEETVYFMPDESLNLVNDNLLLIGFKHYSSILVIPTIGLLSGLLGGQVIDRRIRSTGQQQTFLNALILSLLTITNFLIYAILSQQAEATVSQLLALFVFLLPVATGITALFGKKIIERRKKHGT